MHSSQSVAQTDRRRSPFQSNQDKEGSDDDLFAYSHLEFHIVEIV